MTDSPPPLSLRTTRARRWLAEAAAVILGALLLLAVVVADGRPVVFADTNIYDWMGHMQMRPLRYALAPLTGGPASIGEDPEAADEPAAEMHLRHTEMGARSAWFGLLFYLTTEAGGLWAYAALQSLAASFAIRALWRQTTRGAALEHLAVMAALAAATTLPFFAGFAMPDLWAGVGLVALATLLFARGGLGRASQAVLWLLLAMAMTFHRSNALAAIPAVAASALAALWLWRVPWRRLAPGLGLFVAAVVCATALQGGYEAAVKRSSGDDLRSPPFLDARILADGPGRTYLRRSCAAGATWDLCRFAGEPLTDSQDILWSGDPRKGVYGKTLEAERIRLDREQMPFVLAAIASDPLGEARAAVLNTWRTLIQVDLEDPLRDPHYYLTSPDWKDTYLSDLVHDLGPCGPDERACKPRFDEAAMRAWHGTFVLLSLAVLLALMLYPPSRRRVLSAELGPILILLLLILVTNAAVTGVLSGPFARYQARIAWLPLLCALLAIRHAITPPPLWGRGTARSAVEGAAPRFQD